MTGTKRRRQHNTGTVYQRKDGRWIGRYRNGFTANGTVAYKSVSGPTKEKAQAALNKAIRDAKTASADVSIDPRATVKSWCDKWLTIREAKTRPKTFATDKSAVRLWIIPTLGNVKLTDLTPEHLRKLDRAIKAKGRSLSTVKRARDVLMLALKAAAVEGYAVPSRLFMTEQPSLGISDRAAIPVQDSVKLLQAAPDRDRSRWAAALLQGMRQGECLGLTWDAVDLENGLIDISWQLQELVYRHGCEPSCGKKRGTDCKGRVFRVPDGYEHEQVAGRWHWTRPKTKAGTRMIPLVPWMAAALEEWRKVAPRSPHNLVWPAADGGPRDPKVDRAAFHALQEAAGVEHPAGRPYHLHEARHATATLLMALGVDTQVIVALMGHSSILSTRTYQHSDLQMMRAALDGVAERLQLTA